MVARHHPEYTRETLCLRAGILTLNRLLPAASMEEKNMARLRCQIARLMNTSAGALVGRQALFKFL
eukprot:1634921-Lingulodinium_polyedra.AAC.1